MRRLALLLLCGCLSKNADDQWWQPSEVYGEGTYTDESDRFDGLNGETWAGTVGLAWPIGLQRRAYMDAGETKEGIDMLRGAIVREIREQRDENTAMLGRLVDLEEAHALAGGHAEKDEATGVVEILTHGATDHTPGALGLPASVWTGVSLLLLAGVAWIANRAGYRVPWFRKHGANGGKGK